MKTVAAFSTPAEAHLAVSHLAGSGVTAVIRDEYMVTVDWFTSNAIGGVKVQVDEADWIDAREILAVPHAGDGLIRCPFCGSGDTKVRVLSLRAAVCMLFNLPIPLKRASVDCMDCKKTHSVRIDGR